MSRLLLAIVLALAVLSLAVILVPGGDLHAQEEDVLIYLPIILKDHDPSRPWHSLTIDKSALSSRVRPGQPLTYTIRYQVGGNEPAPGVTLVDTLPQNTTFMACPGELTCSHTAGTVNWNLGTVAPPTTGLVTLTVQVDSTVISGTVLINEIRLSDQSGRLVTNTVTTPVKDIPDLDVAIVFDMSGSIQFDTICYGCYEPYGDGAVPWQKLDYGVDFPNPAFLHPIPTDHLPRGTMVDPFGGVGSNTGNLCEGRDGNVVDYYTGIEAGSRRYIIIEAELYSLNNSVYSPALRQPGEGYWAIQHTNWRTVHRLLGETWDPDSTYGTGGTPILPGYGRASWVSHHPWHNLAGHDYTLAEVQDNPDSVPSLEYDFITSGQPTLPWNDSGDTRIWGRVQAGGTFADTTNLYWAVYNYYDLLNNGATGTTPLNGTIQTTRTNPVRGSNYGGADGDRWRWVELTQAGLDLADTTRTKYTLKIWAGGPGYDIDQIVIGNANDTGFTSNYSDGSAARVQATAGSAFRQTCNRCNPIYGLTVDQADCLPPLNNGWSAVGADNTNLLLADYLFSGYQPIRATKEAVKHFIQKLEPEFDQVGLVGYSTDAPAEARVELRCQRFYPADQCFSGTDPISYTEVLDMVERVPSNGSTNIGEGILRGLEMLGINAINVEASIWTEANDCDTTTDHCNRGESARRIIIVMTDGVANLNPYDNSNLGPNCWADTSLYLPDEGSTYEIRGKDCSIYYGQIAVQNNVDIYTIGLGNGTDAQFLETLASIPGSGGQFYAAASTAQLDDIFDAILQELR